MEFELDVQKVLLRVLGKVLLTVASMEIVLEIPLVPYMVQLMVQ